MAIVTHQPEFILSIRTPTNEREKRHPDDRKTLLLKAAPSCSAFGHKITSPEPLKLEHVWRCEYNYVILLLMAEIRLTTWDGAKTPRK